MTAQTNAVSIVPDQVSYRAAVLAIHSLSGKRPNPDFQKSEVPVPRLEQKVSEFMAVSTHDVLTACALAKVNPEALCEDDLFSQLMTLILRGNDMKMYIVRNRKLIRSIKIHREIGIDRLNDEVLALQNDDRVVIYCMPAPRRFADVTAQYDYVSQQTIAYHIVN